MQVRELITKIGFEVDLNMIKRAEAGFKNLAASAEKLSGGFAKAGLAMAAAVVSGAAAIAAMVKSTTNAADESFKASQKVGIQYQAYQKLSYAASIAGVSQEQLSASLKFLSKNLVDASEGGKETTQVFKKLGIEPKKYLNDTGGLLIAISEQMAKMQKGAKKTSLAQDLLGKGGPELIPFFNQGGEAIRKMMEEAELFGQVFDEDIAKQAGQFNDNLTLMGKAFGGIKNAVGTALLPLFREVSQSMIDWYRANGKVIRSNLLNYFKKFSDFLRRLGPPLEKIIEALGRIFGNQATEGAEQFQNILENLGNAVEAVLGFLADWLELWAQIVNSSFGQTLIRYVFDPIKKAIQGVGLILDDLAAYFRGDNSLTGEMIKAAGQIVDQWMTLFQELFAYLKIGFLETFETAKGLADPLSFLSTIKKLKSGEAFQGSEKQKQSMLTAFEPIRSRNEKLGSSDFIPILGTLGQAIQNIRSSPVAQNGMANASHLLSASQPATLIVPKNTNAGTSVVNKNVQLKSELKIGLPEGALYDTIKKVVQEALDSFLRTADGAVDTPVV